MNFVRLLSVSLFIILGTRTSYSVIDNSTDSPIIIRRCNGKAFQRQITFPNTTYVIKRKVDLQGETVSIPQDCVLEFRGGYLKNGTVVFNRTQIGGTKVNSVFRNVEVKGLIKGDCYAGWFTGNDILNKLISIAEKRIILKENSVYLLNEKLIFPRSGLELYGNAATVIINNDGVRFSINAKNDILIKDLCIDGKNRTNRGISLYRCNNTRFENVSIKNISWDNNTERTYCYGIELVASNDTNIENCVIEDVRAAPTSNVAAGICVSVSGTGETSKNITIQGCKIRRIWSAENGDGLGADCIVLGGRYEKDKDLNAIVRNCEFSDFTKRGVKGQAGSVTVTECEFSFTSYMKDKGAPAYAIEIFGNNSYVTDNRILLEGKPCLIGIGVYAGGKTTIKDGVVAFDEDEITRDVVISGNEIIADQMTYGILVGIANRKDANQYKNIIINNNVIKGRLSLGYGIRAMDGIEKCQITNNTIENASIGIWLNSLNKSLTYGRESIALNAIYKDVTISDNVLKGPVENQKNGVQFDYVSDVTIKKNVIQGYRTGIMMGSTNTLTRVINCFIDNNTITNCKWGIETNNECKKIRITDNIFEKIVNTDMILGTNKKDFTIERNSYSKGVK